MDWFGWFWRVALKQTRLVSVYRPYLVVGSLWIHIESSHMSITYLDTCS